MCRKEDLHKHVMNKIMTIHCFKNVMESQNDLVNHLLIVSNKILKDKSNYRRVSILSNISNKVYERYLQKQMSENPTYEFRCGLWKGFCTH